MVKSSQQEHDPGESSGGSSNVGPARQGGRRRWLRYSLLGLPIGAAAAMFVFGIVAWGGFNTAMEATNTMTFCISCHEMRDNVYKEYRNTIHYNNRSGVRASCSDCHVPDPWLHKFVRKIQASRELYYKVVGSIDTPEKFEAKRLTLAKRVWDTMKHTDSRECRNCHNFQSMDPGLQRPRARQQHLAALEEGQTCIDCHKGIAHKGIRDLLSEEELAELEKPRPSAKRQVPPEFLASLAAVTEREEQAEKERQAQVEAAEATTRTRIEQAVEQAVAAALAKQATSAAPGPSAGPPASAGASIAGGIDWDGVPAKQVVMFYPGQASFEWVLTGKDHGGARAVTKAGDRCATCHVKETADMGAKIVSGDKAEATPIPGKRGSIDVAVQAAHDGKNLYMRFRWPDGPHNPVPFAEGGKMDPDNQVKVAVMIAGQGIEYVEQAGCWATCHHDSRHMPDAPGDDLRAGAGPIAGQIDIKDGITKYLGESRSEMEVAGRRGKARGGWDKVKSEEDVAALVAAGTFMDLIRFRSGADAQNGHVLAQRVMTGGDEVTAEGRLEQGEWTVILSRPLGSDRPGDIPIEPGKTYTIGFAVHDDYVNGRFHHVSLEYRLALDDPQAEINAAGQ